MSDVPGGLLMTIYLSILQDQWVWVSVLYQFWCVLFYFSVSGVISFVRPSWSLVPFLTGGTALFSIMGHSFLYFQMKIKFATCLDFTCWTGRKMFSSYFSAEVLHLSFYAVLLFQKWLHISFPIHLALVNGTGCSQNYAFRRKERVIFKEKPTI